jgi:hypothetical protein
VGHAGDSNDQLSPSGHNRSAHNIKRREALSREGSFARSRTAHANVQTRCDEVPADLDQPWRKARATAGFVGDKHCRFHDQSGEHVRTLERVAERFLQRQ